MKGWGFYYPQIPKISPNDIGVFKKDNSGKIGKKESNYDLL